MASHNPLANEATMPTPNVRSAFFYGTLMAPSVLQRVISRSPSGLHIRPAVLPSFRRHRVRHADYPAIIPAASNEVRGTYVHGLTESDLWRLDIFEGSDYARKRVRVKVLPASEKDVRVEGAQSQGENGQPGAEEEVDTETYVWIAPREELEDAEWDFNQFVKERLWEWAGEDENKRDAGFGDVERAVKAAEESKADPTHGRRFSSKEFEKEVDKRSAGR